MRRQDMRVEYDPDLDPLTWDGYNPRRAAMFSPPSIKKTLGQAKGQQWMRENARKLSAQRAPQKSRREEAEQRLAETVRLVVNALETGMTELMEIGHAAGAASFINQRQLHNCIFHLKTKCGVKFDAPTADPYSRRVRLDPLPLKRNSTRA